MESSTDRITIDLRGYCFYCLGKISDSDQSPAGSPICTPQRTPLRNKYRNVHSIALTERVAPLTDLARYLGVDLPDCYEFGDGMDPEMLSPPLCKKCYDLSARLCFLHDELQDIHAKINNTVQRIYKRVGKACDQTGALKRESFKRAFKRKSKGGLSRGRGECTEFKKIVEMLKNFQMKIIEKEATTKENTDMNVHIQMSLISCDEQTPVPVKPAEEDLEVENLETSENSEDDYHNSYLPNLEDLRSVKNKDICKAEESHIESENVEIETTSQSLEPVPVLTCEETNDATVKPGKDVNHWRSRKRHCKDVAEVDLEMNLNSPKAGLRRTTRFQARKRLQLQSHNDWDLKMNDGGTAAANVIN